MFIYDNIEEMYAKISGISLSYTCKHAIGTRCGQGL